MIAKLIKKLISETEKGNYQWNSPVINRWIDGYSTCIKLCCSRRRGTFRYHTSKDERRYAEEKAVIDKKYFDKQEQERQNNLKKAQEAYKKEAEEAKKAKESQIDDAQNTIKNSAKLLSYIKKQKDKCSDLDIVNNFEKANVTSIEISNA